MTIKRPKYLYFIVVNLNGEEVMKFGISNHYERRFKEYRDSKTIGDFVRVLSVYKTSEAKKIETSLKWFMKKYSKPILKQEYFSLEYFDILQKTVSELSSYYSWKLLKLEDIRVKIRRNKRKGGE